MKPRNNGMRIGPHPAQEVIAIRSLVDVVENWVLRPNRCLPACPNQRRVQSHFHHVAGTHTSALGHAVDQRLVEVENERLLVLERRRFQIQVRGLASRDQRSWRSRSLGVPSESADGGGGRLELCGYVGGSKMTGLAHAGRDGLRFPVSSLS